jgi:PmbA protein
MNIDKFAESALRVAAKLRLDDIEVLLTDTHTLSARIENHDVTLELQQGIFAAAIRVLKRGRIGYVPLTEPDPAVLAEGIRAALVKAPAAPFAEFARIDTERPALKTSDPAVARLSGDPARVRSMAEDLIARAYGTGLIETLEGGVNVGVETRLVATLHGRTPARAERTEFSAYADVNSKDFAFTAGGAMPELDEVAGLGAAAARSLPRASVTPDAEGMRGRTVPAILHPLFVDSLLRLLVAEHLYASTHQEGMSRYSVGNRVASGLVTLVDDRTDDFGGNTFPTDDEGTASRRTTVIDAGVLKTFLYDRAAAAREGVESTGNGRRRPVLIEEPHEAPVRCGLNDLFVLPGATPLAEMLAGVAQGLVVKTLLGFHTANKTTGDFANTLYHGRIVRNGTEAALPEPGTWSVRGNALDCLKSVTAVSRETMATGNGRLPWLLTELAVG